MEEKPEAICWNIHSTIRSNDFGIIIYLIAIKFKINAILVFSWALELRKERKKEVITFSSRVILADQNPIGGIF